MFGTNFGSNQDPVIRVGQTQCASSVWVTATSLTGVLRSGYSPASVGPSGTRRVATSPIGELVSVSIGGVIGTRTIIFTYDAPQVTRLVVSNNPVTGGGGITIHGRNFGPSDTAPDVLIGESGCQRAQWISDTAIVCRLLPGVGGLHTVAVTVGRSVGTQTAAFSYDSPLMTYVTAPNAPTSGMTSITILGMNFGNTASTPAGTLLDSACKGLKYKSDTSIICAVPAGYCHSSHCRRRLPPVFPFGRFKLTASVAGTTLRDLLACPSRLSLRKAK